MLTMFTFTVVSKLKYVAGVSSGPPAPRGWAERTDEMNTVHITFIMSHVASCRHKDKDKESAFIARGHSLQSSFFFSFVSNLKESLSETSRAKR